MVVLHLQSNQFMSLFDAVMGYRQWNNLILSDADRAALEDSKRHIAKDILREKRRQETRQRPSSLLATRTIVGDALNQYISPAPTPPPPPTTVDPLEDFSGLSGTDAAVVRMARGSRCELEDYTPQIIYSTYNYLRTQGLCDCATCLTRVLRGAQNIDNNHID
jgi:hypothetical protein